MKRIAATALLALVSTLLHAADAAYDRVQKKLDDIQSGKVARGSAVRFTQAEINGWARVKVPEVVPEGMREPRVELGENTATGYAIVDFLKMRQAKGKSTNWFVAKLIEGERPLAVTVHLESGGGRCNVHLDQVRIGDAVANGSVLDFLIETFFKPLYPDAKIDEPFDLDSGMDRIEIHPGVAVVVMKR